MGDSAAFAPPVSRLLKLAREWASGVKVDFNLAAELRHAAILSNHRHYFENIPFYRQIAQREGVNSRTDIRTIKRRLMLADGVFKSYDPAWLDEGHYGSMSTWLSGLHERTLCTPEGVASLDDWLQILNSQGLKVPYSSGTSGKLSFVPRSFADWSRAKTANIVYLGPLLNRHTAGRAALKPLQSLLAHLSPSAITAAVGRTGIPGFDACFLGFRSGGTGNQLLMADLAPLFKRHYFLYQFDLTAGVLRALQTGARNRSEEIGLAGLTSEVTANHHARYRQVVKWLEESAADGRKVFIFGAPFQYLELCRELELQNRRLELVEGSIALFGGGWKAFDGEQVERGDLVCRLTRNLGLAETNVLEGYSMTESSVLTLRCDHGRFHFPPLIEPVFLDERLNPVDTDGTDAVFGFLDPLAVSYPGFIISGDRVQTAQGECRCGLWGPAVTSIRRDNKLAVKGCGGIMAAIRV